MSTCILETPEPQESSIRCRVAGENQQAILDCPSGERIIDISHANYGNSQVWTNQCGNFTTSSCSSDQLPSLRNLCLGRSSCVVNVSNAMGDQCPLQLKYLAVTYTCSNASIPTLPPTVTPTVTPTITPTLTPTNNPTASPGYCNGNGVLDYDGHCLCFSGYAGSSVPAFDCVPAPFNCSRTVALPTQTSSSPIITNSQMRSNSVFIEIQSSIVIGRTISQITIGSCDRTFIKLNNWFELDCKDTFITTFPLSETSNCNISKSITEEYTILDIPVVVRNTEIINVAGFNISRMIYDTLSVQIRLPNKVETGNTTHVNSTVAIQAVVTKQAHISATNKVEIEFITISPEPFYLSAHTIVSIPPGFSFDAFGESTQTGSCVSSACLQTYFLTLSPSVCTMTGSYIFDFVVNARHDNRTSQARVTLDLTSSNFCSVVDVPVTLASQLFVYADAAHTNVKNDFAISEFGYFDVETRSPQTTIVESEIEKITLSSSSSSISLYENSTVSRHGSLAFLEVSGSSFSLQFINTVFVVFPGEHDVYDITVRVGVTYEGLSKRREVREVTLKTTTSSASSQLVLQDVPVQPTILPTIQPDNSSGHSITVGILSAIIIALITLF